MVDLLYKYKSLEKENFKFFIDIILNNRIYAPKFSELNDPMEGAYFYRLGNMKFYMGNKLSNVLPNLRLCSFSRVKDDPLMWSYYSNGHKGVAIGVRINDVRYSIEPVNYNKDLPSVSRRKIKDINGSGKYILTHKLKNWCHEQETRVFLEDNEFIDAEIVEINTGRCISDQDYCLICKLVSRINPNIKIIKAETFMGFPDFLINDAIDTPGVIPIPCDFARAIF